MFVTRLLPLIIIQIIIIDVGSQTIGESEDCTTNFGETGTCVPIEKCPQAVEKIKFGVTPKLCGFQGTNPIVCCNIAYIRLGKTTADEKCSEYVLNITRKRLEYVPTLIIGGGGEDAHPLEFPHMATLGYGSVDDIQWNCGGSLISETFVLTAAHCKGTKYGNVTYVKLGVHQISKITSFIQTFNVKNVHIHPNYTSSQNYHDIALIELDRPANIQTGIKPACLYTLKELPSYPLIATGWGSKVLYEGNTDTLQKMILSYVPYNSCLKYYGPQRRLNNGLDEQGHICADGGGKRIDTCDGDSGGPLQFPLISRSLYTIVGITSFGFKCAIVPAVYIRVSSYIHWIESIVWPQ